MASTLKEWHNQMVMVITSDGRIIVGKFIGHDQVQNIILSDAVERIYSPDTDCELVPLGLYMIRGDTVCIIGQYDDEKLTNIDTTVRVTDPLPSIQQQLF